jgi:hypothetical protein
MTIEPGRVVGRGAIVAVLAWIPSATLILLTNVVFPTRRDNDGIWVPVGYAVLLAVFTLAGLTRASTQHRVLTGAVAGGILGVLIITTFAVVDNVFLEIVSRQQAKIDGLRESNMASMRDYINSSMLPAGVVMMIEFAVFGMLMAATGGALYDARRRRG